MSIVQLLKEILQGLGLCLTDGERLVEVADIVDGLEFGDLCAQHEGEEADEEVGVVSQDQVGLATQLLESDWRIQMMQRKTMKLIGHWGSK